MMNKQKIGVISFLCLGISILVQTNLLGKESSDILELKVAHFGPPTWTQQTEVLNVWMARVVALTHGKVRFTVYPNGELCLPSEMYDGVITGKTDIGLSITEYTPDRFPMTSSLKLPFLGESGAKASLVLWNVYERYLKNEFHETKVLWLWCHGPGHLHTTHKKIRVLADLKGLRIKVADAVIGKAFECLGAVPVICTIGEAHALLLEGKLDGVALPWEGVAAFHFLELCRFHTEINMYTLPFFAVMNREKYDSAPEQIKNVIDRTTGESVSVLAGRTSDKADDSGKALARKRGDFIYVLPKSELERWRQLTMPVGDQWVYDMERQGLPGQEVLTDVVSLFIQLKE